MGVMHSPGRDLFGCWGRVGHCSCLRGREWGGVTLVRSASYFTQVEGRGGKERTTGRSHTHWRGFSGTADQRFRPSSCFTAQLSPGARLPGRGRGRRALAGDDRARATLTHPPLSSPSATGSYREREPRGESGRGGESEPRGDWAWRWAEPPPARGAHPALFRTLVVVDSWGRAVTIAIGRGPGDEDGGWELLSVFACLCLSLAGYACLYSQPLRHSYRMYLDIL
ncbi:hypothetical protein NDU88_002393 [Pleurodeles waltl]|uniref:Uncharacterized protein n=1 Tax=Pleurodeles waltl TaxID=8319 RepID=A0AAV7R9W4_PLEWA|nr:hypothetical protein NDU88_002393 [Pleurodeles waltl]